jgi:hypothetical protein
MDVLGPKYLSGARILYNVPDVAGNPIYRGRIVRRHWHSNHENEGAHTSYWSYTVVTGGMPDKDVLESEIIKLDDL